MLGEYYGTRQESHSVDRQFIIRRYFRVNVYSMFLYLCNFISTNA